MKNAQAQLQKILGLLRNNVVIIFFIIFGAMYAYLIFTSSQQVTSEPSDAQISEKYQGAKRPKVDESAAEALQRLNDQNIEVKSLFDDARNNPFAE